MKLLHDFFFPRGAACLYCGHPRNAQLPEGLCQQCLDKLEENKIGENACPRCMTPLDGEGRCAFCQQKALGPIRAAYAPFRYQTVARQLILQLKFHYQDDAAPLLARHMLPLIPPGEYDALVPVPLHKRKERFRGANQAEILCRLMAAKAGLPILTPLSRIRYTRPQKNLTPYQRQTNVRDAFTLTENVQGLRLLLVDDIRTTGATARECARALLRGKAKYVGLLTTAIATKEEDK